MAEIDINGIIAKSTGVLDGLTSAVSGFNQNSQIVGAENQNNMLSMMYNSARTNYGSLDQLANSSEFIDNINVDTDFDSIRGGSVGQRIGSSLSTVASTAAAGSVFGPWGALAGAVVGLGASGIGWANGDIAARTEQQRIKNDLQTLNNYTRQSIESGSENLLNTQHRQNVANSNANGGKLKRQMSITEFADRVINKTHSKQFNPNSAIVREMCDGGVRIRIKR